MSLGGWELKSWNRSRDWAHDGARGLIEYANLAKLQGYSLEEAFNFHSRGLNSIRPSGETSAEWWKSDAHILRLRILDGKLRSYGFASQLPIEVAQEGKAEPDIDIKADLKQDELVIRLEGRNPFGDPIFSYIKLTMEKMYDLRIAMLEKKNFTVSDYGAVIASGRGKPSRALRRKLAAEYGMRDM